MKRRFVSALVLCLSLAMIAPLVAQAPQGPPAVLRIYREEVKQGKNAAHEKTEINFARTLGKTGLTYYGMDSMSGPNEAWFIERYESYAALEKQILATDKAPLAAEIAQLDAQDGEYRSSSRVLIATHNRGASYLADRVPALMAKARFVQVTIIRVRPGRQAEYLASVRAVNAAQQKLGNQQPRNLYNVVSGTTGPTYLAFVLRTSLAQLDPPSSPPAMTFAQAMGGDEAVAKNAKTISDVVISQENLLFRINPRMSHPAKEVLEADKEFWAPKAKAAAPAAAKKTAQ
jgi:hypothetical protein